MLTHLNSVNIISDLHEKGFENDFQLIGNDLFWVQGNIFIRTGEFSILEYHKVPGSKFSKDEIVVFGIVAPCHSIKGILLNHYKSYTNSTPPVLIKKLKESGICVVNN